MPLSPTRRRRVKKKPPVATLTLVSLMDLFTIILLFLLQSYSATSETFTSTDNFKLPASTATAELRPRLTVQITKTEIIVEGSVVASTGESSKTADLLIPALYAALEAEAKKSVYIAGINESVELTREVVILGDRNIPFVLLEKIMYTCGQVGYNNIRLAVVSVGK